MCGRFITVSRRFDALVEYRPDCVLSDLGLPGIDGYRLAEMIRQNESFRGIRLIALSAYNEPEKAQSAGFDRHLLKPANPDLLQSTLRMLLMLDKRLDRAEKLIDKQSEIVAEARNFIQEVKADVKEIKGDIREVKQDVQEIKEELRENREKGEGYVHFLRRKCRRATAAASSGNTTDATRAIGSCSCS